MGALFLAFAIPSALAQRYSFKYYGQEQGLSNLATECLFQDRVGYLWVGTQNGLFRYDGASFTRFGESDGLPSSSIESLTETPDGVLWVATQAGLARRTGNRFEEFRLGQRAEHSNHSELASDAAGRIYLSTNDGLMVSQAPAPGSERKFELLRGQPHAPAHGVHVDRNGVAWFGCGASVCRFAHGKVMVFDARTGVPAERWDAILTDHDGNVWIRSSQSLLKKLRGANRFEPVPESIPHIADFAALSLGRNGELFVPTDEGVWELSKGRWREIGQPQGLMTGSTSVVFEDREGSVWIGLWGAGLARWLGRDQWEGWTSAEGLSGEHVWMMTRDLRGDLWVATNKGVNQMHRDGSTGAASWTAWKEKDGLAGDKTRAITLAADGALWVGSSPGGLSRIDPATGKIRKYSMPKGPGNDRIWNLSFDRSGTLWISTLGGLFFTKPESKRVSLERQILPEGDDNEMISAALEDRRGRLWISGTRGLARRENGVWRRFTTRDGLPSNSAGFLAEAPDGSIWTGYRDRSGLSKIKVEGGRLSIETYNDKSGLRSDQAIFVRVDRRGWLWFGTDHGVDVLRNGRWRHYGQQDGMIWDDCDSEAFYEDRDGSIWIGTSRGLAHFRVPREEPARDGPQVEFSQVQLGKHIVNDAGPIVEPYRNRTLSAQLSVLTFLAEGDVLCRYKLTGLDRDWLETKQREVRFSNLPYGKFTLEAMARNAAGEWSRTPARLPFEILPPWWATWWFRLVALVWALLFVQLLIRWRTQRLREEQGRLETAVEERTHQLREEQARIERQNSEIERLLEDARRANRMKDEFLANMSHEIRTPMHGIIGMVNSVLTEELPPAQKDSLETVHSCAQSLLAILNDILDFSKIEADRMEIVAAPFRVRDTVQSACSIFTAVAHRKGVRIEWRVDEEVPEWLICDAGRIRQVLLNLVGNAVKFTHRGEVRVSVNVGTSDNERVEVHFAVSDTGIGIPPEARSSIFEAFRQADGSTSRSYGGTGLGLTISSRLVGLMGGEISVESEIGVGSVFHFWVAAQTGASREVAEPQAARPERPRTRPLHILLAEDNLVNQRVATALLRKRGHHITVVANGQLAVERSRAETFDVILMDLQMPDTDGWEATRQIRQ